MLHNWCIISDATPGLIMNNGVDVNNGLVSMNRLHSREVAS